MQEILDSYIDICNRMHELRLEKMKLEKSLIDQMLSVNEETLVTEKAKLQIYYRSKYDYDIETIRNILEPKNIFRDILSIKSSALNNIVKTVGILSEDEIGCLLDCIKITNTKPYIKVVRYGN